MHYERVGVREGGDGRKRRGKGVREEGKGCKREGVGVREGNQREGMGRKRGQGRRKRGGNCKREGRDDVREDGVRDGKEAKVAQGGRDTCREMHTPTTTKEFVKHGK